MYWKAYHASKINNHRHILNLIMQIVEALGSPWRTSKRGRKPKFLPKEHAAICIYMRYFNPSTVGWAIQRMPVKYIKKAIKLLHLETQSLLREGVFIADSTGIETDRYKDAKIVLREAERREFRKLHVIADYFYGHGIFSVACAGESFGHSHDSPAFREIFDQKSAEMAFCLLIAHTMP